MGKWPEGKSQQSHFILWTGGPFISELRMFPSNASGRSSRHCFSTFYGLRTFFRFLFFVLDRHSVIIITQADFQMCQGFREQRVQICVLPGEIMDSWNFWSTSLSFARWAFFSWSASSLSCCSPWRAGKERKVVKISCLFLYNERPAKNKTNKQKHLRTGREFRHHLVPPIHFRDAKLGLWQEPWPTRSHN